MHTRSVAVTDSGHLVVDEYTQPGGRLDLLKDCVRVSAMARGIFIIALALFAFQASGLASAIAPPECRDGCPDDDPTGHCPPACACCSCCFHPAPVVATSTRVALPIVHPSVKPEWIDIVPATIEPHEILHIPKSAIVRT